MSHANNSSEDSNEDPADKYRADVQRHSEPLRKKIGGGEEEEEEEE